MDTQRQFKENVSTRVKEPKKYNVILLNDDFTTMEFVVAILMEIFNKDPITAETIMMDVHKKGRGVVGSYPYDIAATKVNEALNRAKAEGFPFRMSIEEA
ncbi:MAG: ATP-dependent Clp protease adaptor ClpS [Lachnospiraceae bacterium]|nr:ATP-dependent Clp protease adaptor ClpS [Lachnospiraceae bacterium]